MKKKVFLAITAMAVALVTSLSVPTTAYATSVTTTTEVLGIGRTEEEASETPQVLGARRTSASGDGINISKVTDNKALESVKNMETVAAAINVAINSTVQSSELTLVDVIEVKEQAGTVVSEENPLFITFSFPGITADTEAYILHYSNGVWKVVPTTVYEGKVVGKFTSLSPVAIVTRTSSLKGAVKGAGRKKSPRTGDDSYLIILACGAVATLAVTASLKKRFS